MAVGGRWVGRGTAIRLVGVPRREDGGESAHGGEEKEKGAEREVDEIRGIRREAWFKMK